uniref:dihydrodipicolinate synthase family protein n=1 Tax=Bosea sp. (in: a-proteobacteria) TaxID=1871050 RepID=UPI003B3AC788
MDPGTPLRCVRDDGEDVTDVDPFHLKVTTMSLTAAASGVFPIAPTPFLPDGSVDWASTEKLFAFYDAIGSDGTTVLGIMGEAPKLEPEESVRIVEAAVAGMPGK